MSCSIIQLILNVHFVCLISEGRKAIIGVPGPEDDALEAALGLGDLAGLTVNNEADPLSYDVSIYRSSVIICLVVCCELYSQSWQ